MTRNYFGKSNSEWEWESFANTENFSIPKELLDWVIGQDKALEETRLCIDEWVEKLLYLKRKEYWKVFEKSEADKPSPKEWLPSGPFLLLLGDAGTGKSLIGRALSTYMTDLYRKKGIELNDVLSWKNETNPSEPKISIHPAGKGKKLSLKLRVKALKKNRFMKWGFRLLQGMMIGFGITIIGLVLYFIGSNWSENSVSQYGISIRELYANNFLQYLMDQFMTNAMIFYMGIGAISMGAMLFIFKNLIGRVGSIGGGAGKGGGGAESLDSPKLIIDNSSGKAPFIDATGHTTQQLFGSISWTPFGTAGPPEHQRVVAGAVHRAHLGILYIDEIKNLIGSEAVTLLTVLEDGQLPITLRSQIGGAGGSAEMAVSTEAVPCMNFFIAAGNMDSVPQIHHALMDRIAGYGKIVYMNNTMSNTVENRRKCVQFISQEVKRFNLLPFNREACIEIIEESRRKSGRKDRLVTKFRPLISVIKTASIVALNRGSKVAEVQDVKEAIEEHCKSIHRQVLERFIETEKVYAVINPNAKPKIGQIHGIGITTSEGSKERIGGILPIRASIQKIKKKQKGYFHITGVKTNDDTWVQHSILKVRHVITQLYNEDPKDSRTHIDFAQQVGVDGPSAGVAMTLALCSIIEGEPLRQDVAVTGEINIGVGKEVLVTPIGGTHEKIMAAQRLGFKKVLIPSKNFKYDIRPKDYEIKIVGCATLEDYKREIFNEKN